MAARAITNYLRREGANLRADLDREAVVALPAAQLEVKSIDSISRVRPGRIAVEARGERIEGVTAVVQNSDPFTYFNSRPVKVCRGAALDNGVLSMTVLMRARQRDLPGLGWKLLTGRGSVSEPPEVRSYEQLSHATVSSLDPHGRQATFPVQVDGDYIGEFAEATFEVRPASLLVVA